MIKRCNMKIFNSIAIGGGKNRQSNIEALRLLSMLMVLNLHSFWGYDHGSGIGQFLDFFRESTSICAVNAFLLISGYFGIKWKFKSFYNLVFQLFFYSFGVYLAAVAFGTVDFSLKEFARNATCLYAHWGFISMYVLLYFLAPLLNAFVEKVATKELFIFVLILFLCENFISRGQGFLNFMLLYLIGRWLNKTNSVERLQCNAQKLYWITTIVITLSVYTLALYTPINNAEKMTTFLLGYGYNSPFVILQAVFLFLVFARLSFTNKYINWCASSCLAIFLIHMHPTIKYIGYYAISESFYSLPVLQHILYLIGLIASVFFGAILIDKIRIVISEFVYMVLCRIASCLPKRFLSIDTYIPTTIKNIL